MLDPFPYRRDRHDTIPQQSPSMHPEPKIPEDAQRALGSLGVGVLSSRFPNAKNSRTPKLSHVNS